MYVYSNEYIDLVYIYIYIYIYILFNIELLLYNSNIIKKNYSIE